MTMRGVLHMHSTYSYDGKVSLSALKDLLVARGVSFCCMSEHTDELTPEAAAQFVAECQSLSDKSFLFIPGFEVPYKDAHVLHFGCTDFLGQFAKSAEDLKAWRAVASIVVLAHPVRNTFAIDEHLESVIDGVEIWNQQYEGKAAPRFRSIQLYTDLQKKCEGLIATGGLDLHRREHVGTPYIELDIEALDTDAVLTALKAADFTSVSDRVVITGAGKFVRGGGFNTKLKSWQAISLINTGKAVNALLARAGISLPQSLRQFIRARV